MNGLYISRGYKNIKVIPCDIDQYYHINFITILQTEISVLPVELFNLNLRKLVLCNNFIKILPSEIKYLLNLYSLDLSNNNLSTLPKELFSLNLLNLSLFFNDIEILPREIKNLTNLRCLDLGNNLLSKLPEEIFYFKNMCESCIGINNNKFMNTYGLTDERLKTLEYNGFID